MNDNHDLHDERISRLYKMGDGTEPPAHIDAEIRQAARDAAAKRHSYTWPSLATAAVLVLSISLVLKVLNQQPLEEAMMEPQPQDELSTSDTGLYESEKKAQQPIEMRQAPATMDQEEPQLPPPETDRFKARRLMVTPAPKILKKEQDKEKMKEGAADFDSTPKKAVGEIISSNTQRTECSDTDLPKSDSDAEWIKRYRKAVEQGQVETANCIKQAFQDRFNRPMPQPTE